jgi:hypothetical protein
MVDTPRGTLEDALKQLRVLDMSGGLVTDMGALSLGSNQTPDSLNVFSYLGDMHFRGGFKKTCSLPGKADASDDYIDLAGIQHQLFWCIGDIYDTISGTPVLVASGVYTAGEQVAHCHLNGIMYWATLTVPIRQYDGVTEMPLPNFGGVGTVPPPACNYLLPYAGSLVAIYPVPLGIPQKSQFMWSVPNIPGQWFGDSIQTVGSNDGGICTFGLLVGIIPGAVSNPGVPSTKQLLVAKSEGNIFLYQGALGSMTENAVPCPVGAQDPNSAVYIPTKEGLGAVMFLGSDGQFWLTNGSTAQVASINIKTFVYQLTQNALLTNPNQKFFAVYNARFQYYLCDFGNNTQLAYKWDTGAWWLFKGWPSGTYLTGIASTGLPAIYIGSSNPASPGVFQIGLDQTNDNGNPITAYYKTPYLHGGQAERQKIIDIFTLFTWNVGVQYRVIGQTMPRSDGSIQTATALVMNDPAFGATTSPSGTLIWNSGNWNQQTWGGGVSTQTQPYELAATHGHLNVLSTGSQWMPAGIPSAFRSGAVQFTISWSGGIPDFRVVGYTVGMLMRSIGFVGALPFETRGNAVSGPPDPFIPQ